MILHIWVGHVQQAALAILHSPRGSLWKSGAGCPAAGSSGGYPSLQERLVAKCIPVPLRRGQRLRHLSLYRRPEVFLSRSSRFSHSLTPWQMGASRHLDFLLHFKDRETEAQKRRMSHGQTTACSRARAGFQTFQLQTWPSLIRVKSKCSTGGHSGFLPGKAPVLPVQEL